MGDVTESIAKSAVVSERALTLFGLGRRRRSATVWPSQPLMSSTTRTRGKTRSWLPDQGEPRQPSYLFHGATSLRSVGALHRSPSPFLGNNIEDDAVLKSAGVHVSCVVY